MRMKSRHFYYGLGAVFFCALFAAAGMWYLQAGSLAEIPEEYDYAKGPSAVLKGFSPGAEISYKVFTDTSENMTGTVRTDENGVTALPGFENRFGQSGGSSLLTYDFLIEEEEKGEPLGITMTINQKTGHVRVMGNGISPFENVTIARKGETLETRADWAGILKSFDDLGFESGPPQNDITKLAFSGGDLPGSETAKEPSSYTIEVLSAPGCGGPAPTCVNQFVPLYCGTHPQYTYPLYSFCPETLYMIPPFYYPIPPVYPLDQQQLRRIPIPLSTIELQNQAVIDNVVHAMIMMTEQLSTMMMVHVQGIGLMLDAKNQMEVQREYQALAAQAHKDYHPSESMCYVGSFVKSLPVAEEKAAYESAAVNDYMMNVYTAKENASTEQGYSVDIEARIEQYRLNYCDQGDNNNGLALICGLEDDEDPPPPEQLNADIDFARTVQYPLTLDVTLSDEGSTPDEEAVLALARNLYWPQALDPALPDKLQENFPKYMEARNLFATQNVAHNSFASLVGMKSRTIDTIGDQSGWAFMKAYMREFGLEDEDIDALLGEDPSYYAQMEVMTKKIYQNPNFYTNLYDKPVNVDRMNVSMDAIKLMQGRDHFESALRKEMLMSLMVERELARHQRQLNANITSANAKTR